MVCFTVTICGYKNNNIVFNFQKKKGNKVKFLWCVKLVLYFRLPPIALFAIYSVELILLSVGSFDVHVNMPNFLHSL
jgi:hypothetical protein